MGDAARSTQAWLKDSWGTCEESSVYTGGYVTGFVSTLLVGGGLVSGGLRGGVKLVGPGAKGAAGRGIGTGIDKAGVAGTIGSGSAKAGVSGRILWTSWQHYPKVTKNGREYAQVGKRMYTQHAVDRMQPSGLGAPAGGSGPGRSISPNLIEDVLTSSKGNPVKGPNGEARLSFESGTVQVITENGIVITVITR